MSQNLRLYLRHALLGVSAGAAALLLSTSPVSAQVGDPKASPQDNPAGHVGSGPDERSRDNNDSARDTDTRDTTRSASHTASEREPITGTKSERSRTTRSREAITNRGQRGSGLPSYQQQDQEYSQGNVTEGSSVGTSRRSDRSTPAADRSATSRDTLSEERDTLGEVESSDTRETRTANRNRFNDADESDSESTASTRSRDTARSSDDESATTSDDNEIEFRDDESASDTERRSARSDDSRGEDSRSAASDAKRSTRRFSGREDRASSREDRFGDRDARSDYRDTAARDRASRDTRSYSRDAYRDEDRYSSDRDDRSTFRDEDRYRSRDTDRYARDYNDRDYGGADRARSDRDRYDRGSELGRDVRETARDVRDTARDVRDTVRSARDAVSSTTRSTGAVRDTRSVRSSSFDVNTVRPADVGVWFNRSTRDGLVISNVATSGPLSRVGFREGDQIVSVNGTRVRSDRDFMQYLFANDIRNQRVPVIVYRGGAQQTVYVRPSTLVEYYSSVQSNPLDQIGIVPDDRYYDRVVVWRVLPRTPAYYAGIQPGDVITTWDNARISRPNDLVEMVQETPPGEVEVQVYRGRQPRQLSIDIPQLAARETSRTAYRPEIETSRTVVTPEARVLAPATGTYVEPGVAAPAPVEPRPGVARPGGILRGGLLPRR